MQPRNPRIAQGYALLNAGRLEEGVAVIADLAAADDPEALFALADLYWHGGPVPQDRAKACELFGRASDLGHPIAALTYTNLLANGAAGLRDWPEALRRLRAEAGTGPRRARTLDLVEAMELTSDGDPRSCPTGERLNERPEIARYPGLLTGPECDYLIAVAEPAVRPSMVTDAQGREVLDPIRSSHGASTHALIEDPAIHALNRRLAAVSGSRVEQAEPLQTLRYAPGQQYRRHFDWLRQDGHARILTALVYLNEGYAGGETEFTRLGLRIAGRKGDGLVFRNGTAEALDPMTEHAGLPVTSGVKYLASRWIHDRPLPA